MEFSFLKQGTKHNLYLLKSISPRVADKQETDFPEKCVCLFNLLIL